MRLYQIMHRDKCCVDALEWLIQQEVWKPSGYYSGNGIWNNTQALDGFAEMQLSAARAPDYVYIALTQYEFDKWAVENTPYMFSMCTNDVTHNMLLFMKEVKCA